MIQGWIIKEAGKIVENLDPKALYKLTELSFREEENLVSKWDERIRMGRLPFLYQYNWRKANSRAELHLSF